MSKLVTAGEIVVEIMALERGRGFRAPREHADARSCPCQLPCLPDPQHRVTGGGAHGDPRSASRPPADGMRNDAAREMFRQGAPERHACRGPGTAARTGREDGG
jgi:hypothetical protein